MNNQISTLAIATDALNSSKYLVLQDALGMTASETPPVRQMLNNIHQDHLRMVEDWFRYMENKGWYRTSQPTASFINQMASHVQSLSRYTPQVQHFTPNQQQFNQYY